MTAIEEQLREHYEADSFGITLPPDLSRTVRVRGARLRRRRAAGVIALAVAIVAVVGGGVVATIRRHTAPAHVLEVTQMPTVPVGSNPIATYVDEWSRGDFESIRAKMTPSLKSGIPASAIASVFGEPGQGAFLGVTRAVTVGSIDQGTLTWQHRTGFLTVVNSPKGITGLVIYDEPTSKPLAPSAVPAAQAGLGTVLSAQVDGHFDVVESMLSPDVAAQLPLAKLESAWRQVTATFGTVRGFIPGTFSGPEGSSGVSIIRGDILLTGGRLTETLSFDTAGQLAGITFTLPPVG